MNIDFDHLWHLVTAQCHHAKYSIHAPDHWRRVERNGVLLDSRTGADLAVVRLFALFHDSRRDNDDEDPGYGARGAELAASLCPMAYQLSDEQFQVLHYACTWHTDGEHHRDPTIGTCWDADRLDVGRAGVIPEARFMSTAFAREIVAAGSIEPFLQAAGV